VLFCVLQQSKFRTSQSSDALGAVLVVSERISIELHADWQRQWQVAKITEDRHGFVPAASRILAESQGKVPNYQVEALNHQNNFR
jgi:hypothetical protein